jgi:hypothetical protein
MQGRIRTKIDQEKLKEALSQGLPMHEAAKIAGSNAKSRSALAGVASQTLRRNPIMKKQILDILEDKRSMMLDVLNKEKINKANAYQLVTMAAIFTDKIQLLKGLPTARIAGDIDFNAMKPDEIKRWLQQKLTGK